MHLECGSPLVLHPVMPPVEHWLHKEFHRDDDLFDVGGGGSNADRAASGSVKPDLTTAGYPSGYLPPTPYPFSVSFILLFRLTPPLFQSSL